MQQTIAKLAPEVFHMVHTSRRVSHGFPIRRVICFFLCGALSVSLHGCGSGTKLPQKSSKEYAEAVSAFYIGLSALQVGDDVHADSKLSELTALVPGEPAGWANWGVLALRQRKLDVAAQRIERARSLAPNNDQIYQLLGLLESSRGNSANAIASWRKAVEINPGNYRAAYQLAEEVERQGDVNSDAEYQRLIQKILTAQPQNLAAQLELARIAAKSGDAATLKSMLGQITSRSTNWPAEVKAQLLTVQAAADGPNPRTAATRTTFLRNTLMRVPEFRESLAVLKAPPCEEAEPCSQLNRFVKTE
jgi:tetratricopeptide (TPR) repeat protein